MGLLSEQLPRQGTKFRIVPTPPVGLNLFVMSRVARIPVMQVFRGGLPFYSILFAVLLLVTYIPALSLWLPNLVFK